MKKRIQLFLAAVVITTLSIGCSGPAQEPAPAEVEVATEEAETAVVEEEVSEEAVTDEAVTDEATEDNKFPAFQAKNLKEEEVTESLFAEYELTLVNIWGTTCAPCIREMPELEKLQKNYADKGLKVVGIVSDGNYLAAGEIVNAILVTYEHIIPNEEFALGYLSEFQFIPTTLFVDGNGVILGEPMVGAYDYETFEEKVKSYLELE